MHYYEALQVKVQKELAVLDPKLKREEAVLAKLSSKLTSLQLSLYRTESCTKACSSPKRYIISFTRSMHSIYAPNFVMCPYWREVLQMNSYHACTN